MPADRRDRRDAPGQAPRLRGVANVAVGYNNINVAAVTRRRIVVTTTPGVLTETTADFTWALLFAPRRDARRRGGARAGRAPSGQDTVLEQADFTPLHVPLLPETRHYIGERELRLMKPTAYLVNAARGPVVHESALVRALQEGWIAGTGLDVYEDEPRVHPGLLACRNAVLAPHVASASRETRLRMATMAVEDALEVLEGRRPAHPVNPDVFDG